MKWIAVDNEQLNDGTYYLATRYGIHNFPDIVFYLAGTFYSIKEKVLVEDVAYVMELPPHPTGHKEVINFQPSKDFPSTK